MTSNDTPYFVRDDKVYHRVLGEETPLTNYMVEQTIARYRVNADFLKVADPDKSRAEAEMAEVLEGLLAQAQAYTPA